MPIATITRQAPEQTAQSAGARLYREAYERGLNVSQLLERMDPTSEREPQDRQLDAFERVLRAQGIITRGLEDAGILPSTWEEAVATPERRALMPELFARIWRRAARLDRGSALQLADWNPDGASLPGAAGQTRAILLSGDYALGTIANAWYDANELRQPRLVAPIPLQRIVARTTGINGDAYRAMYITDTLGDDAYRMKRIAEGAEIPRTTLISGEHSVRLFKYGRAIESTYEQLRRQTLDRIAFLVARIRLQAEVDKVAMVLNTIINGDGNANTAATVIALTSVDPTAVAGTLTLRAWQVFQLRFALTYAPDIVLGQEASISQLLMLPVATGNQVPYGMQPSGAFGALQAMQQQLGATLTWAVTADAPALKLVTFQSAGAVEQVSEIGGTISEVERFINNQTQLLTMTEVEGYMTLDPNSARILNING